MRQVKKNVFGVWWGGCKNCSRGIGLCGGERNWDSGAAGMRWRVRDVLWLFVLLMVPAVSFPEVGGEGRGVRPETARYEGERRGSMERKGTVSLNEIVVTAVRRRILLINAPSSVTLVGRKAIEESSSGTVDDVLRFVAGVDNWGSNTSDQGFRKVWLRGVGEQGRTLVLVDGIPINGGWSGWVAWSQIYKEDVERIEVVRGPVSSLYGSGAMGGVINVITKTPPKKPLEIETKSSYGRLNTWSSFLGVSGRLGKFGYVLSGRHSVSDGYIPYPPPYESYHTKNEYELGNAAGRFFWFMNDGSCLKVGVHCLHEKRNRGREYSNIDPRKVSRLSLTYRRDATSGIGWSASVYRHDERWRVEFDRPPTYSFLNLVERFETPFYGGMVQVDVPAASWNTLTMGVEAKHSVVEKRDEYQTSTRRAEHRGKQRYVALYLQDEMAFLGGRFLVNAGARQEWWRSYDGSSWDTDPSPYPPFDYVYESKSWHSFSPKVGVVFHLAGGTTLRGSAGSAFRAPTPARQYATMTRGRRLILGNPDLDPEKIFSYEGGIERRFAGVLVAKVTAYRGIGKDFIKSRLVDPPFVYQFDNISKVEMEGVEVELVCRVSDRWSCSAAYTYNESTVKEDEVDPSIEGNDLQYVPRNKFSLGVTYENPEVVTATVATRFVDEMYDDVENTIELDDYWTVDVKLSRRLGECTEVSISCENVFDEKYDVPSWDIYQAPGRLWTVSVSSRF